MRILLTGGGTGGHVYPAVTVARTLRDHDTAALIELLYVGSAGSLEERVAGQENIAFTPVRTGKLRRASNPLHMINTANLRDAARVPLGVKDALAIVKRFDPHAVLATGGYAAVPIGIAAETLRKPLLIHEQTVGMGLANRILARRANRVALSSDASLAHLPAGVKARAIVTGNPVRPELARGDRHQAARALGWDGHRPDLPTVYVTGGAQGAQQINTLLAAVLRDVLTHANIVHQCGPANVDAATAAAAPLPAAERARYHVVPFLGAELPHVFALADVVVSRSGAGTLAELTALGKPGVLVPLMTSGGNEQVHNARHLADAGAARALVGSDATSDRLRDVLLDLLTDTEARAATAKAALALGRPDAAHDLTRVLLELAHTRD